MGVAKKRSFSSNTHLSYIYNIEINIEIIAYNHVPLQLCIFCTYYNVWMLYSYKLL